MMFPIGFGVLGAMRRVIAAFSPASLFAAGENGAWYDPSDLSTLYQDAIGTIPVTATGQPVGLVLDKSKGLGPELVTNGDFDDDLTGWEATTSASTISLVGGKIRVTRATTAAYPTAAQTISLAAGKLYRLSFDYYNPNGLTVFASFNGIDQNFGEALSGGVSALIKNTSSTLIQVGLRGTTGSVGEYIDFDNISVREIQGNHATQITATARPTYQTDGTLHWLNFDGADDWLVTPTIMPSGDVAQIISGMRVTGTGLGIVAELGNDSVNGDFRTYVSGAANTFVAGLRGPSGTGGQATSARTVPFSAVFFANLNGAGLNLNDQILIRTNGVTDEPNTFGGYPGVVTAFSTDPIYIGRRTGTAFPLNGQIYGLIIRFGDELSFDARAGAESYLAGKAGVVIA